VRDLLIAGMDAGGMVWHGRLSGEINMNERAKETFHVLVADDSEDDRLLLRTAMRRAARMRIIAEVSNGEEAINYLSRHGTEAHHAPLPLPHLLLLDLKMPVRDGFAVLEWLRAQKFDDLTVVALTGSMQPDYIRRALDLGADFFQVKPRSQKDCVSMVLALEERLVNGLRVGLPWHTTAHTAHAHIGT
jgi:CheY-like chemotaxis protein